jgi:hypothetical protein
MRLSGRASKKERERYFFERANQSLACWPDAAVDSAGEEPDIVVRASGKIVGIEVTEMLRGGVRAVEETRRVICEKASKGYFSVVPAHGLAAMVVFRGERGLNKREQDCAAKELTAIVLVNVRSVPTGTMQARLVDGVHFTSQWFEKIWLHFHPSVPRSRWQPVSVWWVPRVFSADVQKVINKKELKLSAYLTRTAEVWLLIVVDGFEGSSAASMDDAVYSHQYSTNFTGIVLYEHTVDRAHRLETFSGVGLG